MRKLFVFATGCLSGCFVVLIALMFFVTPRFDENGLVFELSSSVPSVMYDYNGKCIQITRIEDTDIFVSVNTSPQIDLHLSGEDFQFFVEKDKRAFSVKSVSGDFKTLGIEE